MTDEEFARVMADLRRLERERQEMALVILGCVIVLVSLLAGRVLA